MFDWLFDLIDDILDALDGDSEPIELPKAERPQVTFRPGAPVAGRRLIQPNVRLPQSRVLPNTQRPSGPPVWHPSNPNSPSNPNNPRHPFNPWNRNNPHSILNPRHPNNFNSPLNPNSPMNRANPMNPMNPNNPMRR
jgi:hypothetical protein